MLADKNEIENLDAIDGFIKLRELFLESNKISDIDPLGTFAKLEYLYLDNNQISDITRLQNLTNLKTLGLMNNNISDISALVKNKGLGKGDRVNLSNNPLSEKAINDDIPALRARDVQVAY